MTLDRMRARVGALMLGLLVAACDRTPAPAAGNGAPSTDRGAATDAGGGVAAGVHYLERLTPGARADAALPMIVAIHGLGDRPESFAGVVASLGVPARVILPRGLDPYEGGWSWFPFTAGGRDMDELARGIGSAADRLAAALVELQRTRPTRGLPIVTGFSQGGMLSFALAVRHPEVVAAAFPLSGMLPPPLWPGAKGAGRQPAIVAYHGDADRVVPLFAARETVDHLRQAGFEAELRVSPGAGHTVPPEVRRELVGLIEAAAR